MSDHPVKTENGSFREISEDVQPKILVVGCGGAGCNTISRISKEGIENAEMAAVNTDAQDLLHTEADEKIIIGRKVTKGLGTGSDFKKGEQAAMENEEGLKEILYGNDLVFVTCGLGGGTGTGAGPVISNLASEVGALTVGVVTYPFESEGKEKNRIADMGISRFRETTDTTIVLPTDKLLLVAPDLSLEKAFKLADDVLVDTISGITKLAAEKGLINLSFENVRTTFENGGIGAVGFGEASGKNRAEKAARDALENPLLDIDIEDAEKALINVKGSPDMTLDEAEKICQEVTARLQPDAKVAWGARISNDLMNLITAMVIIAGGGRKKGFYGEVDLGLDYI